ncbi:MAG TPA: hemerythrin domain-containing protein [Longimicrobiales bacterium]|nr:hemerythrin domain-containing protein [Longimicrobiales bacterium]
MKITDAFLGEHAVFYAQFEECETMLDRSNLDSLKHAAAVIASALESHAELEDKLLFGPLAVYSDGEPGIFQLMEEEHTSIANFLGAIAVAKDAGRASELLSEMIAAARAHFEKEEQVAFPRVEQLLGAEELRRLGREWSVARGVAVEVTA